MQQMGQHTSVHHSGPQSKHFEIYSSLDNLESSYDPLSPNYKFRHVFYNIANGPILKPESFPSTLWDKYFVPGSNLIPVLLDRDMIETRKQQQKDLAEKLNESKSSIYKGLDGLKIKKEMVKNKYELLVTKFRRFVNPKIYGEPAESIYKLQPEAPVRSKMGIKTDKAEVCDYLCKMNEDLRVFERRISEALQKMERKIKFTKQ